MTKKICITTELTHAEWLEQRGRGLGGSDAGTVCGVNPWKTPYALWLEKTHRAAPDDLSDNDAVHFGTLLEEVVAKEFERRSGLKVARRNAIFQSEENPFMIANIDRAIVGQNAGLECKTTNAFNASAWEGDKVPDSYLLQAQHYIHVMGWERCYIACLIGGQEFVWKDIPRNDALIDALVKTEKEFWEHYVLEDIAPAIRADDDITKLYPVQTDSDLLAADDEAIEKARKILSLDAQMKRLKASSDMLKNDLKLIVGDHAGIEGVCTWKQNKDRKEVDWQSLAFDLYKDAYDGAELPTAIQDKYTTIKEGARPFRVTYKEVV